MREDEKLRDEQFNPPRIVDAAGRPARAARGDERCPECRAPKSERVNAGGFGGATCITCQKCGHEFAGETEC